MANNLPNPPENAPQATPPTGLGGVFADHGETGDRAGTGTENNFLVLVVDDNPADQQLTAIYLGKAWPFERTLKLEFAVDGAEALAKLRAKPFAMVVLDWLLPVLGSGEVLRHLRQQGIRIPVVVISGGEREVIPADLDALQAAFLNKNEMNPDTFWSAISQSLTLLGLKRPASPTPR